MLLCWRTMYELTKGTWTFACNNDGFRKHYLRRHRNRPGAIYNYSSYLHIEVINRIYRLQVYKTTANHQDSREHCLALFLQTVANGRHSGPSLFSFLVFGLIGCSNTANFILFLCFLRMCLLSASWFSKLSGQYSHFKGNYITISRSKI